MLLAAEENLANQHVDNKTKLVAVAVPAQNVLSVYDQRSPSVASSSVSNRICLLYSPALHQPHILEVIKAYNELLYVA